MKRCPQCRRDYYDETLLYCLDDGSALLDGPGSQDEPKTAIRHERAAPSEAATRAQISTTDHTTVLPRGAIIVARKSFDKRLLLAPLIVALIILGALAAYRY